MKRKTTKTAGIIDSIRKKRGKSIMRGRNAIYLEVVCCWFNVFFMDKNLSLEIE